MNDFDNIYLKNQQSISQNLPMPIPTKTKDGKHVFVGLLDVIANVLASSTPIDRIDEFSAKVFFEFENNRTSGKQEIPFSVAMTNAAQSMFLQLKEGEDDDDFVLYLWLKEWRDDFDPSHTKSNRAQVHMTTYTVSPNYFNPHGEQNTFVVSLADKTDIHEEVERVFEDDLKKLRKGLFFIVAL